MWMQTVQDCGTSSADQLSKSYASTAFRNSQLSHRLMPSGQGSIHNVVQFTALKPNSSVISCPSHFPELFLQDAATLYPKCLNEPFYFVQV